MDKDMKTLVSDEIKKFRLSSEVHRLGSFTLYNILSSIYQHRGVGVFLEMGHYYHTFKPSKLSLYTCYSVILLAYGCEILYMYVTCVRMK